MDAPLDSSPRSPELDDSYWSALLEQEEALIPPAPPPDVRDENWVPVQQRVDGRFPQLIHRLTALLQCL